MSEPASWTVLQLLEWTTGYLRDHGSESPRLDAEVLLAKAMSCQRIDLYTRYDEPASDEVRETFREMVRQRANGTPVAYLVGEKEFYSRTFFVSEDVLVPRPETEFVLVEMLDRLRQRADGRPVRVLDVGTGSGILAICVALEVPTAEVTAVDVSPAALALARKNAQRHGVAERIKWHETDLLDGLTGDARYDFIISNPPYISESEFESLDATVREHEPSVALVGGPTGTEIIARLIPLAADRLSVGGWMVLEVSPQIAATVTTLIQQDEGFGSIACRADLAGLQRVISAQRK